MTKKFPKLGNPFPLVGYNGPAYFCDREQEIKALKSAIINGRNVSLIARRRIGKSSLLEHLSWSLVASWKVFYIDLIKTSSLQDLYKILATSLYETYSKSLKSKISNLDLLSRLRMTLGVNPITQLPELSFELKDSKVEQSISSLLAWIGSEDSVLIIMDEFQQVLTYPERNTEGFLRSEMMRHPNIRFIFSGSDQHLLDEMFRSHSRPFFNSTQMMGLDPIPSSAYASFITSHFTGAKRAISKEAIDFILHVSGAETYAVQKICNAIFETGIPNVTLPIAKDVFKRVLLENQPYFERIRTLLGSESIQFKLVKAIAQHDLVFEPTGKAFMSASGFTNSSSVLKALKSIEQYELISRTVIAERGTGYYINDALFRAWLNTLPK